MSAHQKAHLPSQPAKVEKAKQPQQPVRKPVNSAQMLQAPETMSSEDVLAAQQQVGNQVVQRALDKNAQRKRVTDDQGNLTPEISGKIQAKRGSGAPLPANVQKEVAKKFKRDFKSVRLHTDDAADAISRTINARAFTIGSDIFFKKGVFAPDTGAGRETLIHELTHVVQQGGKGGNGKLKLGAPDTAHEKEADRMGKKHASSAGAAPAGAVQREADEEELQMQAEEDELQMQPEEEEELQAQPDAGGVIQRKIGRRPAKAPGVDKEEDDLGLKQLFEPQVKDPQNNPPPLPEKSLGMIQAGKGLKNISNPPPSDKSFAEQIKSKSEKMQGNIFTRGKRFAGIEQNRSEKLKEMLSHQDSTDVDNTKLEHAQSSDEKQANYRSKLMAIVSNPKSSPEEAKAAQEKLDTVFKLGTKDKLKRVFSKEGIQSMWRRKSLSLNYSDEAKFDRKKNLKKAARSGDEEAVKKYTQMKEESKKAKEAKKNAPSPVKDFLKDKVGGFLKKQFGGDKDKDAEKGGGGVTVNLNGVPMAGGGGAPGGGGGGDSSIVAVMQQYAQVVEENKKLKEELAKAKQPA